MSTQVETLTHAQMRFYDAPPVAGEILKAGVVSGLIGGLMMAVWAAMATLAMGLGPLEFPQLIGATFRGADALLTPMGVTVAYGVLLHLVVSAGLGCLFASMVQRGTPKGLAALGGVAFALGVFVMMVFVLVPVVNPQLSHHIAMMPFTLLLMHMLYGACVGLAPMLRRNFARGNELQRGAAEMRKVGPVASR